MEIHESPPAVRSAKSLPRGPDSAACRAGLARGLWALRAMRRNPRLWAQFNGFLVRWDVTRQRSLNAAHSPTGGAV